MLELIGPAVPVLAGTLAKGLVVLLASVALVLLLRRASAALRHLVWTVAAACLLIGPFVELVGLPALWQVPQVASGFESVARAVAAADGPAVGTLVLAAVLVWMVGAVYLLGRIGLEQARLAWLASRCPEMGDRRCRAILEQIAADFELSRIPVLLRGPGGCMPMTWGVFRPRVLLPAGAESWSAARLDSVLRHELAHVRRHDSLSQLLVALGRAIHWPNPLAWYGAHRMRVEREHACDDEVLAVGTRAEDYASELLALARGLGRDRNALSAAAFASSRCSLEDRLVALLDGGRPRHRPTARQRLGAGVMACAGMAFLGAVTTCGLSPEALAQAAECASPAHVEEAFPTKDCPPPQPVEPDCAETASA